MVAKITKRKTNGDGEGEKNSGKAGAQPQKVSQTCSTVTSRGNSDTTAPQQTDLHRVVDMDMEDTSPQLSCLAIFSEQLREIDQVIKEFDIVKEEKEGKAKHVVYSLRMTTSHGEPQVENNLNMGPERRFKAHTTLGRVMDYLI